MPDVVLVGRVDCHLCEEARRLVGSVCDEYGVSWREVDVDADPADRERWGDWVPVLLVDGREVDSLRVSELRLRRALDGGL